MDTVKEASCLSPLQTVRHSFGNIKEADPALKKGLYRDLVGGIEHGGSSASLLQSLACQAQSQKAVLVRGFESQRLELDQVEARNRRRHARRPGKGKGDRRAHVGARQLGQNRAVGQRDKAVNDRLRMNDTVELVRFDRKQMVRL